MHAWHFKSLHKYLVTSWMVLGSASGGSIVTILFSCCGTRYTFGVWRVVGLGAVGLPDWASFGQLAAAPQISIALQLPGSMSLARASPTSPVPAEILATELRVHLKHLAR
jgi:hypothetical protein